MTPACSAHWRMWAYIRRGSGYQCLSGSQPLPDLACGEALLGTGPDRSGRKDDQPEVFRCMTSVFASKVVSQLATPSSRVYRPLGELSKRVPALPVPPTTAGC